MGKFNFKENIEFRLSMLEEAEKKDENKKKASDEFEDDFDEDEASEDEDEDEDEDDEKSDKKKSSMETGTLGADDDDDGDRHASMRTPEPGEKIKSPKLRGDRTPEEADLEKYADKEFNKKRVVADFKGNKNQKSCSKDSMVDLAKNEYERRKKQDYRDSFDEIDAEKKSSCKCSNDTTGREGSVKCGKASVKSNKCVNCSDATEDEEVEEEFLGHFFKY